VSHQRLGQFELGAFQDSLQNQLTGMVRLVDATHPFQVVAQVSQHLFGGVELADQLCELVVDVWQLLFLDLDDLDLDLGVLATVWPTHQGGGELLRLARLHAGQGLVQAVEHAAGAELVRHIGRLGVLKHLAILARSQVDGDHVTGGGSPLHVCEGSEPLAQQVEAFLDVFIGNLRGRYFDHYLGQVR